MIINLPFNIKGIKSITLWPFIFIEKKEKGNKVLINHEKIHMAQAKEMWVIGFYVLYTITYILNRMFGFSHKDSYRNLPWEEEAFSNQSNLDYLKTRKKNAWKDYV